MEDVFLGYESALEFWNAPVMDEASRRPGACANGEIAEVYAHAVAPMTSRSNREYVRSTLTTCEFGLLKPPIHILVPRREGRRRSSLFSAHLWGSALPEPAFVRVCPGTYASTPAFLFLQMATELSLARLALLGYRLCGTYAEDGRAKHGLRSRNALMSTREVVRRLESLRGLRGIKRAREALGFVLDGAASPMEAAVALLLSMPLKVGGYGLPQPMLNCRIDLPGELRGAVAQDCYVCDLLWPKHRVAVEYDSDMFHTGSRRIAHDSERRNALAYLGITVVTVTRRQAMSLPAMDRVAAQLRGLLGVSGPDETAELYRQRLALRAELLPAGSAARA